MIILKINYKKLFKFILIPLILGGTIGIITSGNYKKIIMPSFAPPKILFPIVWSILYILMGISRYLIDDLPNNNQALKIYNLQLTVNLLWSFFFFSFKWFFFSFLWIILLIILVIIMIIKFYKLSKFSSLIQIPYLLWIIFACILNYTIYTLN